jgi:hypothetical protein
MKFYIATTTSRWRDHNLVRDKLVEMGHEVTYDWTLNGDGGSLRGASMKEWQRIGHLECQGVLDAHFIVVLLPGGKGTHAEVGAAATLGKRTYIHSPDPLRFDPGEDGCSTTFYYNRKATHHEQATLDGFADRLCQMVGKEQRKLSRGDFGTITPHGLAAQWHDEWYATMEELGGDPIMWEDLGDGAKTALLRTAEVVLHNLRPRHEVDG